MSAFANEAGAALTAVAERSTAGRSARAELFRPVSVLFSETRLRDHFP